MVNRDGSMYSEWAQEAVSLGTFTTDPIARDVLNATKHLPLPLDELPIRTAMSQKASGLSLLMKLFLFGYMRGVHYQRCKDRASEQKKCLFNNADHKPFVGEETP